jgi:hypothetical protein
MARARNGIGARVSSLAVPGLRGLPGEATVPLHRAPMTPRTSTWTHARQNPAGQIPIPTLAAVFEVATGGRLYRVEGAALQRWIVQRREEWKGPREQSPPQGRGVRLQPFALETEDASAEYPLQFVVQHLGAGL